MNSRYKFLAILLIDSYKKICSILIIFSIFTFYPSLGAVGLKINAELNSNLS